MIMSLIMWTIVMVLNTMYCMLRFYGLYHYIGEFFCAWMRHQLSVWFCISMILLLGFSLFVFRERRQKAEDIKKNIRDAILVHGTTHIMVYYFSLWLCICDVWPIILTRCIGCCSPKRSKTILFLLWEKFNFLAL